MDKKNNYQKRSELLNLSFNSNTTKFRGLTFEEGEEGEEGDLKKEKEHGTRLFTY